MGQRIWSTQRKWWGNLLPMLISAPMLVTGLMLLNPAEPFEGYGLYLVLGFPFLGWIVLNMVAPLSNNKMRDELARFFQRARAELPEEFVFAGIARPEFKSVLDPHEDVAFIWCEENQFKVFTQDGLQEFDRDEVLGFGRKPNIHTLLGLGGWVKLSLSENRSLLIEPREKSTLLGNRLLLRVWVKRWKAWKKETEPPHPEG